MAQNSKDQGHTHSVNTHKIAGLMVIFKYSLNVTTCGLITVRTNHKKQEATKRLAWF